MMASGLEARRPTRMSLTSPHLSPWSLSNCSRVSGHFALRASKSSAAGRGSRASRVNAGATLTNPQSLDGASHTKAASKQMQSRPLQARVREFMAHGLKGLSTSLRRPQCREVCLQVRKHGSKPPPAACPERLSLGPELLVCSGSHEQQTRHSYNSASTHKTKGQENHRTRPAHWHFAILEYSCTMKSQKS